MYRARSKITKLLIPTHAHFRWLKFIKNILKKLLHVSVYDHHQGVTMSLPKLLLLEHSCMYAKRGGVAAATQPRLAYIQLCLSNSNFGNDIVTPW